MPTSYTGQIFSFPELKWYETALFAVIIGVVIVVEKVDAVVDFVKGKSC